ncbi:MAG: DUF2809 domain-containing protein [Candidatus Marinimicrobia bacterium]|nr:DUF2809 domain-containing protein [bacterium]MCG2714967.1 DUF2809 domain-containing protein [Candidatus Neomarinimicrobiota bacterium]
MALLFKYLYAKRVLLVSLLIVIPIGFYSKFYSGSAHTWVNNSLVGVFYEIFWCLVLALFFKRLKPLTIALIVLSLTCVLEFMQLWHPPLLELLRGNFIGVTILGNSFTWSDFPYYFVGSLVGYVLINKIS